MRTLSNSEISSSAKGSNEEGRAADVSDNDSWTVSHDMNMIDEVHTSQESENLSQGNINNNTRPTFFNLGIVSEHIKDQKEPFRNKNLLSSDDDEWTKVRPPRSQRQHIELKDITENDFLSMIEAKNQDKRFYGWLNFQPLFQGIEMEDPTEAHERKLRNEREAEEEEDQFLFFNDLFGLNMEDDED